MQRSQRITNDAISQNLFYVTMRCSDGAAWYYLAVDNRKSGVFHKKLNQKQKINLAEWGEIIESGFGENSPEYIRLFMKKKYNFVHEDLDTGDGNNFNADRKEMYLDS